MEGCDPGSCDSHVTSKGETSTVTTTSGSFDNTETSSGGSHGDGSRGGTELEDAGEGDERLWLDPAEYPELPPLSVLLQFAVSSALLLQREI